MSHPKVSIGLPVFNGEEYLSSALKCILEQDMEDFELIISDNASTDGTEEICREAAAKDRRIRYFRNDANIGATGNYNKVCNLAEGTFFKWASHDDEFEGSYIRRCLDALDGAPEAVLAFSKTEIIDGEGRRIDVSHDSMNPRMQIPIKRLASLMLHYDYASPALGLIRMEALRQTRLMGCIAADHVLLVELALLGSFLEIPEPLYRQRRHDGCALARFKSAREMLAWHDPTKRHVRLVPPQWLHFWIERSRAVLHVPISPLERGCGLVLVTAVPFWRWILRRTGRVRAHLGLRRESFRKLKGAWLDSSAKLVLIGDAIATLLI